MPYREFSEAEMQRWWTTYGRIKALDRRYKVNKRVGWIYIMRNPAFKEDLVKIGRTSQSPLERAAELGRSTSVPTDFEVIYFVHVRDCHQAERWIHAELADYRKTGRKEFFDLSLARAIEVLDAAAAGLPILLGGRGVAPVLPQFFESVVVRCPDCDTPNTAKLLMIVTRLFCRNCGRSLSV